MFTTCCFNTYSKINDELHLIDNQTHCIYLGKKIKIFTQHSLEVAYAASCMASCHFVNSIKQVAEISGFVFTKLLMSMPLSLLTQSLPPAKVIFPRILLHSVHRFIARPIILVQNRLIRVLPSCRIIFTYGNRGVVNLTAVAVNGVVEEIFFRGVCQQLLLRKLPQIILRKIAPDHLYLVDHIALRIARVVLVASLFALAHAAIFGATGGMLLPHFAAGIFYSVLVEKEYSFSKIAAIHLVYNLAILTLTGGFLI